MTARRTFVLTAAGAAVVAAGAFASTYLPSTDAAPQATQLRKAAAAPQPAEPYSLGDADALPRLAKPRARAGSTPPPPATNQSATPPPSSNPSAQSPNPPATPPPPPASAPSKGGNGDSSGSGDTLVLE